MPSEIIGARELQRVFRALPDQLARNALRSTARAGANELRRTAYASLAVAMSSRSPREDDVVVREKRSRDQRVRAEYVVGPPKRKPWLRWLHDGTAPHTISTQRRSVLTDSSEVFGTEIMHPGQPSRPWLMTAVHVSQESVQRAMGSAMRKALPRQVKRLVSKEYRGQVFRRVRRRLI